MTDAQTTPITDAPDDILEWVYHMDLHLTQHDVRHAGLALRSAWPHVRAYLYATMLRADTVSELRDKRLIENGLLKLKLSNAEAALTAATARAEEAERQANKQAIDWRTYDANTKRADAAESRLAALEAALREPTEEMWSGLARDIMMWLDMREGYRSTPRSLFAHLENCGRDIPQWLRDEPELRNIEHSISKGTRCVIIFKAMISALPDAGKAEGKP